MLVPYKQNPTAEEARYLRESQWIVGMSKGPGWSLVKQRMQEMIDQCRQMCDDCESSDDKVIAGLHTRLKMTRAVVKDIVNFVEGVESTRTRLINELTSDPDPELEMQRFGDMFADNGEEDEHSTAAYR